MTYREALAHLASLGPELPSSQASSAGTGSARRKFDLAHMRRLCAELGDPQAKVPSVLIAGTNGKGSTAATLAAILNAAGYRCGLYTSPHLVRVNERIQVSRPTDPTEYGVLTTHGSDGPLSLFPIADEEFATIYTLVDEAAERLVAAGELPWPPSFFERLTAIAFVFFAGSDLEGRTPRAEVLVLEVGLGGRLDATNVVEPLVSVITDIALDHQDYLGETLTEIATEKAGILRRGGTLVTLSQHPEVNQAIGTIAVGLAVNGINAGQYLPPLVRNSDATPLSDWKSTLRNRYSIVLEDAFEPGVLFVDSPLLGSHQQRNLALAVCTAITLRNQMSYKIENSALAAGIRDTNWPGRLEFVEPNLLLDVAHNPAGAWTLRAAIAALPVSMPRTLLFSCLRDKDLAEISRILFPLFDSAADGDPDRRRDHVVLSPISNARAAKVDDLLEAAHRLGVPAHAAPHLAGALRQAQQITPADGIIIATGSIYLVGELRALMMATPEVVLA